MLNFGDYKGAKFGPFKTESTTTQLHALAKRAAEDHYL